MVEEGRECRACDGVNMSNNERKCDEVACLLLCWSCSCEVGLVGVVGGSLGCVG